MPTFTDIDLAEMASGDCPCEGCVQTRALAAEVIELRKALRPFADIGISENPDYQPMIRMDRDAILAARAAIDKARGKAQ